MRLFLVTGMHRSGTSAVAAMVRDVLDVDLGPDHLLLGSSPENPRGYFEHAPAVRLDDDVLEVLGGRWDRPPQLPAGWQDDPCLERHRARAAEILDAAFAEVEVAAIKDPRLSLLVPFWRTVHPVAGTIHVIRHPADVVASLARRGVTEARGIRLWCRHVGTALTDDPDALIVRYEDVLDQPARVAADLAGSLGLAPVDLDGQPGGIAAIDPSLRHHDLAHRSTGPILGPAVELHDALVAGGVTAELLASLASMAGDVMPPGSSEGSQLAEIEEELREAEARAQRAEADAAVGRKADEDLSALGERLAAVERSARMAADEAKQRHAELKAAQRAEVERRRQLQRERDRYRRSLLSAQAASAASLRVESKVRRALDRAPGHRGTLAARVELIVTERNHQRRRIEELSAERDDLRRRAEEAEYALGRLSKRRSVRATLKVTALARPVFRIWRAIRRRLSPTAPGDLGSPAPPERRVTVRGSSAPQTFAATVDRLLDAPPVTVVVPVYGAPTEVERCLTSLVAHTDVSAQILVIDDASPDERMGPILERFERDHGISVIANSENLGFVRTVNRGFELAEGRDVVVLNSDTEVTPRWLAQLRAAAYADADVGTATPLSDNAGAFSAPEQGTNDYPDHPLDSIAREITRTSELLRPTAPTGNGFCLYVKRSLIDDIGGLDAANFPRGYGEENDFCMRGIAAGWTHVVDDATLVRHALGSSFGAERDQLMAVGRARLDALHPTYTARVREFLSSDELLRARRTVGIALQAIEDDPRIRLPRILYTMHGASGGTPLTNLDLMRSVSDRYEPLLLRSNGTDLSLSGLDGDGELEERWSHRLATPVEPAQLRHPEYRDVVAALVLGFGIELVHVRQMIHHSLDLHDICRALSIPIVVSLHDYYVVCPTTQLLDDRMRYCAGRCTEGDGECFVDFDWLTGLPHLKHAYVHEWRSLLGPLLADVDALVTTSPSAKDVIVGAHPHLRMVDFRVIEHGRDLEQSNHALAPVPGGNIRILVPGNINEQKGGRIIQRLRQLDTARRLQFVVMGNVKTTLGSLGIELGSYQREEFDDIVRRVAPAFGGIFSIWAETYSHTLSECWSVGLPVLAFDFGAVGERIRRHGGGWLLDPEDVEGTYERILAIADDPEEYDRQRAHASVANLRTTDAMAEDYVSLYQDVVGRRRRGNFAALRPV